MRTGTNGLKLAVAICVVASAASVFAQGQGQGRGFGRGGFGGFGADSSFLLNQEPVQKELELTASQKESAQTMQEANRAFNQDLRGQGLSQEESAKKREERAKETKKKLAEILLPQQVERLDQIFLQWRLQSPFSQSAAVLSSADVAEKLGLTADQKKKLEGLTQETQDKMGQIFQDAQGDFAGIQEKTTKLRDEMKDKAMAALTAEQKEKLEKLQGKKFDIASIQLGGPGGFGGGRRGGQQN